MLGLGSREIIIIAAVLVLLFGAKKIPELAKGMGEAIRHVRNGFKDEPKEEEKEADNKIVKKK